MGKISNIIKTLEKSPGGKKFVQENISMVHKEIFRGFKDGAFSGKDMAEYMKGLIGIKDKDGKHISLIELDKRRANGQE